MRVAIVVDGYSNGRFLPEKLRRRGLAAVHVQTVGRLGAALRASFNAGDYLENIRHRGTLRDLVKQVSPYDIALVIPGCELGVEVADALSARLGLPSNGTRLSSARRDKFLMNEAVRRHGLKVSDHLKSSACAAITRWAATRGRWPVVVKPIRSSGTEGVTLCYTPKEIAAACRALTESRTFFGRRNKEVLIEGFLRGTEYVVNCVTDQGRHAVTDLWVYSKVKIVGAGPVYDTARLLPPSAVGQEILDYVFGVLDALEVRQGASHTEVMMTPQGPRLIECAARIMGYIPPTLVDAAIGRNQIDLMLDSYLDPDRFWREVRRPYRLKRQLWVKVLISQVDGKIGAIRHLETIRAMSSFHDMSLNVRVGDRVRKTVDLFSSPGRVVLLHPEARKVVQDYRRIRRLEKDLFEILQ